MKSSIRTKENLSKTEKPTKFEYIFEDDESKSIWKYDLKKFPNGPISVEYHWKAHYLKELALRQKRGR
jgi:hypothetical protein